MLLNVELLPDGTIPPDHTIIFDQIGDWMNTNAGAIYGSSAWKIFGDNLNSFLRLLEKQNIGEADLEALKAQAAAEHFNERTIDSYPYGPDEVRFTTKDKDLFVFVMNPKKGRIEIPSLGLQANLLEKAIKSISLIGSKEHIQFEQQAKALYLTVPENRPTDYTAVFKIKNVL